MNQITYTTLTGDELKELIIDCINTCLDNHPTIKRIEQLVGNVVQEELPELVTAKEAAKLLSMSVASIRKYRQMGILDAVKIGKSVRFKRSDVLDLGVHIIKRRRK